MRMPHHENETLGNGEEFRMMLVVILVSILAGFAAGYAMRARRSDGRVERHPFRHPYGPASSRQNNSLARARRAF